MHLLPQIKCRVSHSLCDSHTSHSAVLSLWCITSVHRQLCLSGHRVRGDISCDWSAPHVAPAGEIYYPSRLMAKTSQRIFCIFQDTCPEYTTFFFVWRQANSWEQSEICFTLSCNQGPVLVTRACTYKCIFKEVFFSSNTKLETLLLPAQSWFWQGSSNVQQPLMVPKSNHASPQWIQQTLICVFPVLPLHFSQGWLLMNA